MANYKICSGGVLATTVITLTFDDVRLNIPSQTTDCDITTSYKTLVFTSTVPADDDIRIFYTFDTGECYEYGCLFDVVTEPEPGFVTLPAGDVVVTREVKTEQSQCCYGEGGRPTDDRAATER